MDRELDPVASAQRWQRRSARVCHLLFHVTILGIITTSIGMIVLSGAALIIFGQQNAVPPDFWKLPSRLPHAIGAP